MKDEEQAADGAQHFLRVKNAVKGVLRLVDKKECLRH